MRCGALRQVLLLCVVWLQGGISLCPHIILSATLFQRLCIRFRVLRVALLVCTARPYTFSIFWRGSTMNFLDILMARAVNVLQPFLQIMSISCGACYSKLSIIFGVLKGN